MWGLSHPGPNHHKRKRTQNRNSEPRGLIEANHRSQNADGRGITITGGEAKHPSATATNNRNGLDFDTKIESSRRNRAMDRQRIATSSYLPKNHPRFTRHRHWIFKISLLWNHHNFPGSFKPNNCELIILLKKLALNVPIFFIYKFIRIVFFFLLWINCRILCKMLSQRLVFMRINYLARLKVLRIYCSHCNWSWGFLFVFLRL